MKNLIFAGFLFVTLAGNISCTSPTPSEMAAAQNLPGIKKQIENGAFVVDVRTPQEFAGGTFGNAVNIPLSEVEARVAEFQGKPSVIVFCRSGKRASQAIDILKANGIKNITNGINVSTMEAETK